MFYDPMIAKLIAHGETREDARARLADALDEAVVWPLRSNAGFLVELLDHPDVAAGRVDTGLIAREGETLMPSPLPSEEALIDAAARESVEVGLVAAARGSAPDPAAALRRGPAESPC